MLFDAHNHAFSVLGGIPKRGIYDNMKTAVDKVGRGKARTVNARFRAMTGHVLFEPDFCNPAAGWEKGQVEKLVRDARSRIWHEIPTFGALGALNAWLQSRCIALWHQTRHPQQSTSTMAAVGAEEQPHLMKVPPPFDGFVEDTKRVSPTCLMTFERNRYAVPARTIYDGRHYLAVLQRKLGALRNGTPFVELPVAFKKLQRILLQRPGADREMVESLSVVLHHDEQAVLCAVELALASGTVSKQHVLNLLRRLLESDGPPPIDTPAHLTLLEEPQANVTRYDHLRGARYVR